MKMRMEQCRIDTDGGKPEVLGEKPVPSATLHTTNLSRTDLGTNPGLRGQIPSTLATVRPLGRVKLI